MDHSAQHDYYLARAEACRLSARRAASPAIANLHRDMAAMYEAAAVEQAACTVEPSAAAAQPSSQHAGRAS